jgi:hypothetical protein
MNILAYSAKRSLVDAFNTLLASDTVQVTYAAPPDLGNATVYGGGFRGVQADGVAETGVLTAETSVVDIVVRIYQAGNDGEAAERATENLVDQIVGFLAGNPAVCGPNTIAGLNSFDAPMPEFTASPEATVTSTILLRVGVQGVF